MASIYHIKKEPREVVDIKHITAKMAVQVQEIYHLTCRMAVLAWEAVVSTFFDKDGVPFYGKGGKIPFMGKEE